MLNNLGKSAWRLFPALLVALVIAACSDALTPELTAPTQAELARETSGPGAGANRLAVSSTTGQTWKRLSGRIPAATAVKDEKIIGPSGGMLQSAGHILYVPAGAVARPTKFKMAASLTPVDPTLPPESQEVYVEVQLHAYSIDRQGNEIADVGALGFQKPVYLGLSYAWVSGAGIDPTKAAVLWMKTPTEAQEVRTFSVDYNGKWVVGELRHFSIYDLGCNDCD